ncbi:unnamed protein product [Leptosia nina]|uniref:Transposase n=1 Tax=Leptosia nina TaxID=320188 RepID=A0AAV1K497_9NEOP
MLAKRKRVMLTLKDKVDIIECLQNGVKGCELASRYNVGASTISDIKTNSDSILAYANSDVTLEKKTMKQPNTERVDDSLYDWYADRQASGKYTSRKMLFEQAAKLSKEILKKPFVPHKAWLSRFKAKYDIDADVYYEDQTDSEEEDQNILENDSELWGFFDKEPTNRAKCSMCGVILKRDSDTLYKHLKEKHSKISENLEFKDADESYTEVIYLEEPVEEQEDRKPRVLSEVQLQAKKPLKRKQSTRESIKPTTPQPDKPDSEIDNFGQYITGLLRGIPKKACSKLQMDIVSMIMNTKLNMEPTPPDININDRNIPEQTGEKEQEENQENQESFEVPIASNDEAETDASKSEPTPKRPKRRFSYREEYTCDVNDRDEREVENFGKYVTCLLKTITHKDIGTKLQMDIVNLIMTARLQFLQKNSPILTINGTIELQNREPAA